MTPRRVLFFHPALAPYRVDLFNALARRCELRLVFLCENVPNQAFDQARLRGLLRVQPGYLANGVTVAGRTIRFGFDAELRRFQPDVVVTSEFGQATLSVVANRKVRGGPYGIVVGTDDNPSSVEVETRLHSLGRRVLLRHVDCVVTLSEPARAMYRDRFGAKQPIAASPLIQSEDVVRARLAQAGDAARDQAEARGLIGKRLLLYVGRLAPEKRVDRLIDAMPGVRDKVPDAVLALVGDGPERAALEARAAAEVARGSVVFVGRAEGAALYAWYRLGSVFVLSSEYEPFGAVVNEALLAGIPAVCSDRAGARVLVTAGANGEVVNAGAPDELEAALAAWLGREPPVSPRQLESVRASRMEATFAQAVEAYLGALDAACDHRARSRAMAR